MWAWHTWCSARRSSWFNPREPKYRRVVPRAITLRGQGALEELGFERKGWEPWENLEQQSDTLWQIMLNKHDHTRNENCNTGEAQRTQQKQQEPPGISFFYCWDAGMNRSQMASGGPLYRTLCGILEGNPCKVHQQLELSSPLTPFILRFQSSVQKEISCPINLTKSNKTRLSDQRWSQKGRILSFPHWIRAKRRPGQSSPYQVWEERVENDISNMQAF